MTKKISVSDWLETYQGHLNKFKILWICTTYAEIRKKIIISAVMVK